MANRSGAPNLLTPQMQDKIVECLLTGATYDCAAASVGICRTSLYGWLSQGRQDRVSDIDTIFVQFLNAVEKANADFEMEMLKSLKNAKAGPHQEAWQAKAWILERSPRFRKSYGRDAGLIDEMLIKLVNLEDKVTQLIKNKNE